MGSVLKVSLALLCIMLFEVLNIAYQKAALSIPKMQYVKQLTFV